MKRTDSTIKLLLSQNMKRSRKKIKITQLDLARMCKLSASFIAEIESCRKFPSPEVLERIAQALNVLPHQLFLHEYQWEIDDHVHLLRNLYLILRDKLHADVDNMILGVDTFKDFHQFVQHQ